MRWGHRAIKGRKETQVPSDHRDQLVLLGRKARRERRGPKEILVLLGRSVRREHRVIPALLGRWVPKG